MASLPRIALLAALFLSGAGFTVQAQDLPLPDNFSAMDANKDGAVTEQEYLDFSVARLRAHFASLDRNKNKALEGKELNREGFISVIPDLPEFRLGERAIPANKPTAGSRGPSGPLSRRISR